MDHFWNLSGRVDDVSNFSFNKLSRNFDSLLISGNPNETIGLFKVGENLITMSGISLNYCNLDVSDNIDVNGHINTNGDLYVKINV